MKIIDIFYSLVPALLRQSAYGTIKIGVYYSLKGIIVPNPDGKITKFKLELIGFVS